jgi:hypothetical protein
VLGIKGEPSTPLDASQGLVWQSILHNIDIADAEDNYTSTANVPRATFTSHPWSLGGGGATNLTESIVSRTQQSLGDFTESIGRTSVVGEDDCWILDAPMSRRHGFFDHCLRFGIGDCFRDWCIADLPLVIYPLPIARRTFDGSFAPALAPMVVAFAGVA